MLKHYVPQPEPEAEWDVDSYDGREYESNPDIRQLFSDENDYQEFSNSNRKVFESKGFMVDPWSENYPLRLDETVYSRNMTYRELMTKRANLCVKKLNEEKGKTVEVVDIVRVVEVGSYKWNSYITFMAREYPNGPLVEYQAKVMNFKGNQGHPFPVLCRPSPKLQI